jgi:hypothetical protein
MRSDLHEIISKLPFLSARELDALHQRIKALKGSTQPVVKKVNGGLDPDIVVNVICSVLNARGIECPKFAVNKTGQLNKINLAISFAEKAVSTRLEQEALLTTAIDLLWQYMTRQRVPTTGNTLLRNLNRIPAVIDQNFPGYAKAGLLKLIVRQETTK